MSPEPIVLDVPLGFLPVEHVIHDPDHPGLLRAGPRAGGPYGGERVQTHLCRAVDCVRGESDQPNLLEFGFDTVDLSALATAQLMFAAVRATGTITDEQADTIRAALDGATLHCASGLELTVLHVAGEGFIMRTAGPNGLPVVGPRIRGMNGHSQATSVHADQDVLGTPLVELMGGRAPELFRHDSPDGRNDVAGLMLVNLWIPLQQITQPLVLADGRSVDRRRHQLRYGLATESFLDRDEDLRINDIWTFLHDEDQRWYLRSEMDHRSAYVFDTLSTPHGAGALPGEEVAEWCYLALEAAERAASAAAPAELATGRLTDRPATPAHTPEALRRAIDAMEAVLDDAVADPIGVCGPRSGEWLEASRAARRAVVRMSLELRLVVSLTPR